LQSGLAILGQFKLGYDVVGSVSADSDLNVERAHERGMAAGTIAVVPAVMDDNDEAAEGVTDRIGSANISRHVLVRAFGPVEAAV
jgi:hypothetical protein